MASPLIVPDASVLLKWVLRTGDEGDRDNALALRSAWLRGSCDIVVPTLWVFEVGNILGLKQPPQADALLGAMIDLGMSEQSPASYTPEIFRLMRERTVTFYDAAYHALAIVSRGTMLTADGRYVKKAGRAGHVQLIDTRKPPDEAHAA